MTQAVNRETCNTLSGGDEHSEKNNKRKRVMQWLFFAGGGAVFGFNCCALAFSSGEQGPLVVAVCWLLIAWLLLLRSTGSRHTGFSSCGMWTQ